MHGAKLVFGAGAELKSIVLPMDHSAGQISGIPRNTPSRVIARYLSKLGFTVNQNSIRMKYLGDKKQCIANVRFPGPNDAKMVVAKVITEQQIPWTKEFRSKGDCYARRPW